LLSRDLIEQISKYCVKKSKQVGFEIIPMLICNGSFLDEENVKFLQDNLVLFGVSLDGTKKNHDRNRITLKGEGTFDTISKNLRNIKDNRFVGVSMTLDPDFNDNILKCYLSMFEHAPTISIRFMRRTDKGTNSFFRCAYNVNLGYDEFYDFLLKKLAMNDYSILFAVLNGDDYFGKILIRVISETMVSSPCEGGIARFSCTENGVFPCSASSDIGFFMTSDFKSDSEELETIKSKINQHCLNCVARFYCGGKCPIVLKALSEPDKGLCQIKIHLLENAIKFRAFLIDNPQHYEKIEAFIIQKFKRTNVL
jgi:radical SAM protein with 4Fe4S-binding SPASM domain